MFQVLMTGGVHYVVVCEVCGCLVGAGFDLIMWAMWVVTVGWKWMGTRPVRMLSGRIVLLGLYWERLCGNDTSPTDVSRG